jgi:hypothetical protein
VIRALRISICLALGLALLASRPAFAQSADSPFSDLIRKQKTVFVFDANGNEYVGPLLRVEPSSLTIATADGEQSIAREKVSEIYRRGDSVKSGAIIGGAVGAILGGLALKDGGCGPFLGPYQSCSVGEYAGAMAVVGGIGAGIGVGIDALFHGRTRIYPGRSDSAWATVDVVPDAGVSRAGIAVAMRW